MGMLEGVIGIIMLAMMVGFLGFGHHTMMGGHGKESHNNEATVEKKHAKDESCTDCPASEKDVPKEGVNSQDVKEAQ